MVTYFPLPPKLPFRRFFFANVDFLQGWIRIEEGRIFHSSWPLPSRATLVLIWPYSARDITAPHSGPREVWWLLGSICVSAPRIWHAPGGRALQKYDVCMQGPPLTSPGSVITLLHKATKGRQRPKKAELCSAERRDEALELRGVTEL